MSLHSLKSVCYKEYDINIENRKKIVIFSLVFDRSNSSLFSMSNAIESEWHVVIVINKGNKH